MQEIQRALREVVIDPTLTLDSVWRDDPYHVDGLHEGALSDVQVAHRRMLENPDFQPLGLVVQGQKGIGKTHFLGQVRRRFGPSALFVMTNLFDGKNFWYSLADDFVRSLYHEVAGRSQLASVLDELGDRLLWPSGVREALADGELIEPIQIDGLVRAFQEDRALRPIARTSRDALRALLLLASPNASANEIAEAYLTSIALEAAEFRQWRLTPAAGPQRGPQRVVEQLSNVIALVRPTIIAIDQIDSMVHGLTADSSPDRYGESGDRCSAASWISATR